MKNRSFLAFLLFLLLPAVVVAQASVGGWKPDGIDDVDAAIKAFKDEKPVLERYFDEAYAYAVYPKVGKAAFIVGGAHGKGVVFVDDQPVGKTELTQGSVGFQFGGESFSELIFFQNEDAFSRFTSDKLEFGAKVSATLLVDGGSADLAWDNGIAVFTRTNGGLIIDASLSGQKFTYTPAGESAEE
jgi:lipid-binding SYLF domain-containing protein